MREWSILESATAVLDTKGLSTTGREPLDTEGSELSSAMSNGEGLVISSASTVDEASSKEAVPPAAKSRRLGEYLHVPPSLKYVLTVSIVCVCLCEKSPRELQALCGSR